MRTNRYIRQFQTCKKGDTSYFFLSFFVLLTQDFVFCLNFTHLIVEASLHTQLLLLLKNAQRYVFSRKQFATTYIRKLMFKIKKQNQNDCERFSCTHIFSYTSLFIHKYSRTIAYTKENRRCEAISLLMYSRQLENQQIKCKIVTLEKYIKMLCPL